MTSEEVNAALAELDAAGVYSTANDGLIFNRRMIRDQQKRQLCSEAGQRGGGNPTFKGGPKGGSKGDPKGGSKGQSKGRTKGDPNPQKSEVRSQTGGKTPSFPQTPQPGGGGQQPADVGGRSDDGFAEFWDAYPKRQKKAAAKKAWAKLAPGPKLRARIIDAIYGWTQTDDWTREGGRFVPMPAKWLREKRWTDELPAGDPDDEVICKPMDPAAAAEFWRQVDANQPDSTNHTEDKP
jgi:hypothetical protein